MSKVLTGVRWHFSATHLSPDGSRHGHTWVVTAWWATATDAVDLQNRLRSSLLKYDEVDLPRELSRGEALAEDLGGRLANCIAIDLAREPEGIFARWEA